jgi:hypothetical protein
VKDSILGPFSKFIFLQAAAAAVGFTLPFALSFFAAWVLDPVFGLTGAGMAIVAFVRAGQKGERSARLVRVSLLVWAACALGWLGLAFLAGQASRADLLPWNVDSFLAFRYQELPVFTTACLAYFQLGPFRARGMGKSTRQLVAGNPYVHEAGAVKPELIERAERILLLQLPRSYRQFLLEYGELRGPVRIVGLGEATDLDHPTPEDLVGATYDAHARLGLPRHLVVCALDDDDRPVCLDVQRTKAEESPVVVWDPATRAATDAASSFGAYLNARLGHKQG